MKSWKYLKKSDFFPGPSVHVPRAETRLTAYRSPYIRMLSQLVGFGSVEQLNVKSDVFF